MTDTSDVLAYIEENEPVSLMEVDREFDETLRVVHELERKGFVFTNADHDLETTD